MSLLATIWNLTEKNAELTLDKMVRQGYSPKTSSTDPYIKILSCFDESGIVNNKFSDFERSILRNRSFIPELERNAESTEHYELLFKALHFIGTQEIMGKISSLRTSMQQDVIKHEIEEKTERNKYKQSDLPGEDSKQDNNEDYEFTEDTKQRKQKSSTSNNPSYYDNTWASKLGDICPLDPHDENAFYSIDPLTKEKVLLEPHHIFHYQGHCFNYDSIFRYVKAGGVINLDKEYIRKFLNASGAVSFRGLHLTDEQLRNKIYHEETKILDLSDNNITSLLDMHLPYDLTMLIVSNNTIRTNLNLKKDTPNLKFLTLSNCGLTEIDCDRFPKTLIDLDLSNNPNLRMIYNKRSLINLRVLKIANTKTEL